MSSNAATADPIAAPLPHIVPASYVVRGLLSAIARAGRGGDWMRGRYRMCGRGMTHGWGERFSLQVSQIALDVLPNQLLGALQDDLNAVSLDLRVDDLRGGAIALLGAQWTFKPGLSRPVIEVDHISGVNSSCRRVAQRDAVDQKLRELSGLRTPPAILIDAGGVQVHALWQLQTPAAVASEAGRYRIWRRQLAEALDADRPDPFERLEQLSVPVPFSIEEELSNKVLCYRIELGQHYTPEQIVGCQG